MNIPALTAVKTEFSRGSFAIGPGMPTLLTSPAAVVATICDSDLRCLLNALSLVFEPEIFFVFLS